MDPVVVVEPDTGYEKPVSFTRGAVFGGGGVTVTDTTLEYPDPLAFET